MFTSGNMVADSVACHDQSIDWETADSDSGRWPNCSIWHHVSRSLADDVTKSCHRSHLADVSGSCTDRVGHFWLFCITLIPYMGVFGTVKWTLFRNRLLQIILGVSVSVMSQLRLASYPCQQVQDAECTECGMDTVLQCATFSMRGTLRWVEILCGLTFADFTVACLNFFFLF